MGSARYAFEGSRAAQPWRGCQVQSGAGERETMGGVQPVTPTQKLILKDLAFGPATSRDLVPVVRVQICNVLKALYRLKETGHVHICGWETNQRMVWGLGGNKDAPRPLKRTRSQVNKDRWRRITPKQREAYRATHYAWWIANRERLNEQRRRLRAQKRSAGPSKSQESKSSPASSALDTATGV